MPTMIKAKCHTCKEIFGRTLKQTNVAIKKNGFWRCCPCSKKAAQSKLIGLQTKFLLVTKQAESRFEKTRWDCVCVCGSETTKYASQLKEGSLASCGCMEHSNRSAARKRHGMSEHREYRIWCAIKTRCTNEGLPSYQNYGGRGITMSPEWRLSFESFLSDMGNCPVGFSIDRIDNNGNYCKENCRWASRKDQARNTRRNKIFSLDGKSQCVSAWAEDIGIHPANLLDHINRHGFEKAYAMQSQKSSNASTPQT